MFKEKEIIPQPLYITKIENGVTLLVYDGYAKGSDGLEYSCVCHEKDDMLFIDGWKVKETV